jgi:hypothetical protein
VEPVQPAAREAAKGPIPTPRLRLENAFGLRILARWGPRRVAGVVGIGAWIAVVVMLLAVARPDLLFPTDFGTDSSNYSAAAERLVGGGNVYGLEAGDRPVPADNPPFWSVPILSPPTVAGMWSPLLVLSDAVRFYGPWLIGLATTVALGVYLFARAPLLPLLVLSYFYLADLALTAWSGNVNAWIGPAVAFAWWGSRPGRPRWIAVATGVIVGLAIGAKLSPAFVGLWLFGQRRWTPVLAAAVTGLVVLAVTVAFGGLAVIGDYLRVVADTAASPTHWSIPGALIDRGVPPNVARLLLLALDVAAALAILLVRARPAWTFVIAVVALVFATPIVRPETIAIVMAALAPWATGATGRAEPASDATATPARGRGWSLAAAASATLAVVVAGTAGAVSIADGGVGRSTLTIRNDTDATIVVRFTAKSQSSSWGYSIEPHATGTGWLEQSGKTAGPVLVFRDDCRTSQVMSLPPAGGTIQVRNDAVNLVTPGSAAPLLAYVDTCAPELVRELPNIPSGAS